ncbi:unnamed protein product [Auanema sp. JU1783]|nr:unnamed protein product [Auanema sp. JU1783]
MDALIDNSTTLSVSAEAVLCDQEPHPLIRSIFISCGTVVAIVGCFANLLLVYVFSSSTRRVSPFQIYLSTLDFLFCLLFIICFAALRFSQMFHIEWLYIFLKNNSVSLYILSRIVQLEIPYVLIANTADRLKFFDFARNRRMFQIGVIIATQLVATFVRVPGYFAMEVTDIPGCELFTSKILTAVELSEELIDVYVCFDLVVQFFHLFVSFIILCVLNVIVVMKLHSSHKRAAKGNTHMNIIYSKQEDRDEEQKKEQKRYRFAVHATIWIISSYLACNSVNFILYLIEMFDKSSIQDNVGNFNVWYVLFSDIGSILFILSSTIRLFILYRYNLDVREEIRAVVGLGSQKFW